jgi:hypothetical protein
MALTKAAGSVYGAITKAKGKAQMKEADKMAPNEYDPDRLAALEDAKRKTKQLEAGTDTTTQEAIKSANQSTTATQKQIATVTGGNVGGTVSAMLQAMKSGGAIKNQAYAKAGERGLAMGLTADKIGQKISQRALDIKQFKSVQRRAEGAEKEKTGFANMTAGLFGSLPTTDKDGNKAGDPGAMSALLQFLSKGKTTPTTPTTPTTTAPAASGGFGFPSPKNDPSSPFFDTSVQSPKFDTSGLTSYFS